MNDGKKWLWWVLGVVGSLWYGALGYAEPRKVTADEVVRLALEHSPGLRASVLEVKRAALDVDGQHNRYVPLFNAHVGYTRMAQPTQVGDSVNVSGSDQVAIGAGISHTFSVGTTVGAQVDLTGTDRSSGQVTQVGTFDLAASYGVSARVSIEQPLLRGFGNDIGEVDLRAARISERVALERQKQNASEIIRDVLSAYWTLWYAERAEEVYAIGLDVAEKQLAETRARVEAGARAPFDVLPLETEVASAREILAGAQSSTRSAKITLLRLLGLPTVEIVTTDGLAPPLPKSVGTAEELTAAVLDNAWELRELRSAVETAQNYSAVVENQVEPRLNALGWLQWDGVGAGNAGDVFTMLGSGEAISGYVGLEFDLPLNRTAQHNEVARAMLATSVAEQKLREMEDNISAEAVRNLETLTATMERQRYAEETAKIAARSAGGQAARFAAGETTVMELILSEQTKREAMLRVAKNRADIAIVAVMIDHLRGQLLSQVGQD